MKALLCSDCWQASKPWSHPSPPLREQRAWHWAGWATRESVTTVEQMSFCLAPGGPFWMGEGREQHRCEAAPAHYWIGRYPLTHAQYVLFVQAGGYGHDAYWPEAQQAGYWRPGQFKGRYDKSWRNGPLELREPFGLPNHPVVGVTWYEALAFTRWLTDHLRAKELIEPGWAIRLPGEAEWEKEGRGGWQVPTQPVLRSPEQGWHGNGPMGQEPEIKVRLFPGPGQDRPRAGQLRRQQDWFDQCGGLLSRRRQPLWLPGHERQRLGMDAAACMRTILTLPEARRCTAVRRPGGQRFA